MQNITEVPTVGISTILLAEVLVANMFQCEVEDIAGLHAWSCRKGDRCVAATANNGACLFQLPSHSVVVLSCASAGEDASQWTACALLNTSNLLCVIGERQTLLRNVSIPLNANTTLKMHCFPTYVAVLQQSSTLAFTTQL